MKSSVKLSELTATEEGYPCVASADLTSYVNAPDGQKYTTYWCIPAADKSGNEYEVIYRFDEVKGAERETDELPWESESSLDRIIKIEH